MSGRKLALGFSIVGLLCAAGRSVADAGSEGGGGQAAKVPDCPKAAPIVIDYKCRSPIEAFSWCAESRSKEDLDVEASTKLRGEVDAQVKTIAGFGAGGGIKVVRDVSGRLHQKFSAATDSVLSQIVSDCAWFAGAAKETPVRESDKSAGHDKRSQHPPTPLTQLQKPLLVIAMDSTLRRYPGMELGSSNGVAIRDILLKYDPSIDVELEPAYPNWNSYDAIVHRAPDIIALHLSAFQAEAKDPKTSDAPEVKEGNRRLQAFVAEIHRKLPQTRFLIYSRRWSDVAAKDCTPTKVLGALSSSEWPALETEFRVMCLDSPDAPGDFRDAMTIALLRRRLDELRRGKPGPIKVAGH